MKKVVALVALVVVVGVLALWRFGGRHGPSGIILISIDTLRADHLGAYGYPLDTSPFFDEFAARGTLFENAIVQLPGTLPSHMSIFTGLYPAEHGVYPPDSVLSTEIPTLPELFRAAGYRTAGFTEGGYVKGHYGFARGFDVFDDDTKEAPGGADVTFGYAREFIDDLEEDDRFFLFVHTYETHDPYVAPEGYFEAWPGDLPNVWEPTGPNLIAASRGELEFTPEDVEYFAALYDASIRYVDDVLRGFMEHLWAAELSPDTLIVITSDHGEEFFEHGSFVHRQVYNETLHVPLLIRTLGQRRGSRVSSLVESVDIAPTLLELAGLEADTRGGLSGSSLVEALRDQDTVVKTQAYAEMHQGPTRTLYQSRDDGLYQFLLTRPRGIRATVVERSLEFDVADRRLAFQARAYHRNRRMTVLVDGEEVEVRDLEPNLVTEVRLDMPSGSGDLVEVRVDSCDRPSEVADSEDTRCIGVFIDGLVPDRRELYNLDQDPLEKRDLAGNRRALAHDLELELEAYDWEARAAVDREALSDEQVERLRALGYLQ